MQKVKLNNYIKFKTSFGIEQYLLSINNRYQRSRISEFRSGTTSLNIETGRWRQQARHERFCPFCGDQVEDEIHFLFQCPFYIDIRQSHHRLLKDWQRTLESRSISVDMQLYYLLFNVNTSPQRWIEANTYIKQLYSRRKELCTKFRVF